MVDLYSQLAGLASEEEYLKRSPFYMGGASLAQSQMPIARSSTEAFLLPLLQGLGSGTLMGLGRSSAADEMYLDARNSPFSSTSPSFATAERPEDMTAKQIQAQALLTALSAQNAQEEKLKQMDQLALDKRALLPYSQIAVDAAGMKELNKATVKADLQAKQFQGAGLDPVMSDLLAKTPPALRPKVLEEQKVAEDLTLGVNLIDTAYDNVSKLDSTLSMTPFTGSKTAFEAARAAIKSSLQANWKGVMSDQDTLSIEPLLPDPLDRIDQLKSKKAMMVELLKANAKPTPVLRSIMSGGVGTPTPSVAEEVATGATSEIPAGMKLQRNKITGETRLVPQ
jgi:hypothetical protein